MGIRPRYPIAIRYFAKAYDSVDCNTLFKIFNNFGIPVKLIRLIVTATNETRAVEWVGTEITEEFQVLTGLKQRVALSPMLFNLPGENIIRHILAVHSGVMGPIK